MPAPRILLVEDDEALGFVVKDNLEQEGFIVDLQTDGLAGGEAFNTQNFDICLLDVMLPEQDGFTLAEKIREINRTVPIIFLTARSLNEDRIRGFRLGGDDYLTKPFSIEELVLRIEAILRRSSLAKPVSATRNIGKYLFDTKNLSLSCSGNTTTLTPREAALLELLADKANEVVPRESILVKIWGKNDYFLGRSLDVFISRLRKYLSEDNSLKIINVHGVGFKLEVPSNPVQ